MDTDIELKEGAERKNGARLDEEKIILSIIAEIKDVFDQHFDRTWFAILIDDLPMDFRTLRDIRNLFTVTVIDRDSYQLIDSGIRQLEELVLHIRQFLLPVLKEKLGISAFTAERVHLDKTQYIIRKFVFFTFPYNLNKLEKLTAKLKEKLR